MNPLPSRGFTWNFKSYFLWKTRKKCLQMLSAAVVIGPLKACADREDASLSLILHTLIKAIDFIVTHLYIGKKLSREMKETD